MLIEVKFYEKWLFLINSLIILCEDKKWIYNRLINKNINESRLWNNGRMWKIAKYDNCKWMLDFYII